MPRSPSSLPLRLLSAGLLGSLVALTPLTTAAATEPVGAAAAADAGEPATVTDLVKAVEDAYKDVQTLRADFVQVTRSSSMGEGEKQRGRVQLARPRKMRWDFTQPESKLFVTNGTTIWVYTPADKQVFVSDDLGGSDGGMDSLLSNLENLDQFFDVSIVDRQGGADHHSYVLKLSPKGGQAQFKSLRIELSRKRYDLEKLVIVDAFDNETELTFTNLKVNPALSEGDFSFTVPAGIQVVRSDGI